MAPLAARQVLSLIRKNGKIDRAHPIRTCCEHCCLIVMVAIVLMFTRFTVQGLQWLVEDGDAGSTKAEDLGFVHFADDVWKPNPYELFKANQDNAEKVRKMFPSPHACHSCDSKIYVVGGAPAMKFQKYFNDGLAGQPDYNPGRYCMDNVKVATSLENVKDACAAIVWKDSDAAKFTIRENASYGSLSSSTEYSDWRDGFQWTASDGWHAGPWRITDKMLTAVRCLTPTGNCAAAAGAMYNPGGGRFVQQSIPVFTNLQMLVTAFAAVEAGVTEDPLKNVVFGPLPVRFVKSAQSHGIIVALNALFVFLSFSFVIVYFMAASRAVEERESRVKDGLQIMGASATVYHLHWVFTWGIYHVIYTCLIMVVNAVVVEGSIMGLFRFSMMFATFFYLYGVTGQALLLSVFFDKSLAAGLIGALVHICCCFLTMLSLENSTALLIWFPQVLYANFMTCFYADLYKANIEPPISPWGLVGLLFVMSVLHHLLWVYLEMVIPRNGGNALKPWFLCSPEWWKGTDGVIDRTQQLPPTPQAQTTPVELTPLQSLGPGPSDLEAPAVPAEAKVARRTSVSENLSFEGRRSLIERIGQDKVQQVAEGDCVQIKDLCVYFRGANGEEIRAVNGASLTMFKSECFVLLGHNGAGKSTTMSVLTGMLRPTSGSVDVFGMKLPRDLAAVRKIMGFCPQHDVLFADLTVLDHIHLFMVITGRDLLTMDEQLSLVSSVGLGARAHFATNQLSGGMKRKLSVGISLAGNPKLVVLDEPTSGMDPFSRRALWEFLKSQKDGRVLLLTTHFMDEADVLGDRVAIMRSGEVQTCGSPQYLKRKFGCGYILTVVMKDKSPHTDKVKQLVLDTVGSTHGRIGISTVGKEILCNLPLEAESKLPDVLDALHAKKDEFAVGTYGISVTNLEEVFLKVASGNHGSSSMQAITENAFSREMAQQEEEAPQAAAFVLPNPGGSVFQQFSALLVRRVHSARRDSKSFVTVCIVPVVMLLAACILGHLIIKDGITMPKREPVQIVPLADSSLIDVPIPKTTITDQNKYPKAMQFKCAGSKASEPTKTCRTTSQAASSLTRDAARKYNCTLGFDDCYEQLARWTVATGMEVIAKGASDKVFPDVAISEGEAVKIVLVDNTLLANALPLAVQFLYGDKVKTTVTHHILPMTKYEEYQVQKNTMLPAVEASIVVAILSNFAFCFIPIGVMAFVLMEKLKDVKHQLYISGCSYWAYWGSMLVWDALVALVPVIMLYVFVLAFGFTEFVKYSAGALTLILLFIPAAVGFAYGACLLVKSTMMGNIGVLLCNGLCATIFVAGALGLGIGGHGFLVMNAYTLVQRNPEIAKLAPKDFVLPGAVDVMEFKCSKFTEAIQRAIATKDNEWPETKATADNECRERNNGYELPNLSPKEKLECRIRQTYELTAQMCNMAYWFKTVSTWIKVVSFMLPGTHLLSGLMHITLRHNAVQLLIPAGIVQVGDLVTKYLRDPSADCKLKDPSLDMKILAGNLSCDDANSTWEAVDKFQPCEFVDKWGILVLMMTASMSGSGMSPLQSVGLATGMIEGILGMLLPSIFKPDPLVAQGFANLAQCLTKMAQQPNPNLANISSRASILSTMLLQVKMDSWLSRAADKGSAWYRETAASPTFRDSVDLALPDIRATLSCQLGPQMGPWEAKAPKMGNVTGGPPGAPGGRGLAGVVEEELGRSAEARLLRSTAPLGSTFVSYIGVQPLVAANTQGGDGAPGGDDDGPPSGAGGMGIGDMIGKMFPGLKAGPVMVTVPCNLGLAGGEGDMFKEIGKILEETVMLFTIGESIIGLIVLAIFYPLIVIVLEGIWESPRLALLLTAKTPCPPSMLKLEDANVKAEKERVASLDPRRQIMYVRNLRKVFGKTHAVRGVTWAADQGMVLGLLGVNGAGKTTSFKMMAGVETPADGECRILGIDVLQETSRARRFIGYCPQFDALIEKMTVEEHLYLYARMKGLSGTDLKAAIAAKISDMQLSAYQDRASGSLSGGNKRKLSVAMAIIGEPPVVFLDEPSTGMDPFARRFMWGVIQDVAEKRKQSVVVLTTHSMEEAEALCSKIAIQVDGQFRCYGSAQQLKSQYGQGYEVAVKFAQMTPEVLGQVYREWNLPNGDEQITPINGQLFLSRDVAKLQAACLPEGPLAPTRQFLAASVLAEWSITYSRLKATEGALTNEYGLVALLEAHGHMAKWRLPNMTEDQLAGLLRILQARRDELGISDFSCSQATLEQIFNAFAKEQEANALAGGMGGALLAMPGAAGPSTLPGAITRVGSFGGRPSPANVQIAPVVDPVRLSMSLEDQMSFHESDQGFIVGGSPSMFPTSSAAGGSAAAAAPAAVGVSNMASKFGGVTRASVAVANKKVAAPAAEDAAPTPAPAAHGAEEAAAALAADEK